MILNKFNAKNLELYAIIPYLLSNNISRADDCHLLSSINGSELSLWGHYAICDYLIHPIYTFV
jgi:hypothetical protein